MIYAYIRVSSQGQEMERQRFTIRRYLDDRSMSDQISWIEETISGTKNWKRRRLGEVTGVIKKGDTLITDEISRLGRTIFEVMTVLQLFIEKKVRIIIVEGNYEFTDDLQSQTLAMALALGAQIERDLISSRTKAALAAKKERGEPIGRPKGSKSVNKKLAAQHDEISKLIDKKVPAATMARIFGVHRHTMKKYIVDHIRSNK